MDQQHVPDEAAVQAGEAKLKAVIASGGDPATGSYKVEFTGMKMIIEAHADNFGVLSRTEVGAEVVIAALFSKLAPTGVLGMLGQGAQGLILAGLRSIK